ncbi:hypothetical protein ES319_D07G165800v1 [Gossypium barbadense]|uniref:BHLH domain-containing protein n=2 Tax=Gossypium TaxID=3633 RepID=A0A5J5QUZ6_GOSBA|nr:hypothetical protein ES319_D07G165800v1 [Gossypium barbadense]TYG61785.1 hypothetical protein ES288_D07G176900v1 [Gossypium darwinii]TYG61787.1 hypothetical protein ES288_D07G177100v1 [Gossypium darwinii]TYG61788.1 hypothetical protein ES288_D07G177100v1 [Gossypium darwinii]
MGRANWAYYNKHPCCWPWACLKYVGLLYHTDKASMLDEVIEYLKQLQAQVQIMSNMNVPQMIYQLQCNNSKCQRWPRWG